MEELISLLQKIEADDSILTTENSDNPLVDQVVCLADTVLISSRSTCVPLSKRMIMQKAGYNVYPGEKDSFGWLFGCIATKKGVIVFG